MGKGGDGVFLGDKGFLNAGTSFWNHGESFRMVIGRMKTKVENHDQENKP